MISAAALAPVRLPCQISNLADVQSANVSGFTGFAAGSGFARQTSHSATGMPISCR
jgi:hypothetical protein